MPCLIRKEPSSRRFPKKKVSIASLEIFCHLGKGAVLTYGARFKPIASTDDTLFTPPGLPAL